MDSCRISGFVFGPVLCHRSTVPLPLGSGLWDLSPHLLCHLPYHCTSDRVWQDSCYVDLMLRLVWKMTTTIIYALFFFTRISCNLCSTCLLPTEFLWLDNEIKRAVCSGRTETTHTVPFVIWNTELSPLIIDLNVNDLCMLLWGN